MLGYYALAGLDALWEIVAKGGLNLKI